MKIISLDWFATEQQTSTFMRQNFRVFYPKFSAEFSEFGRNV